MEGYLEKQSVKNSAAWKRRWFIMQVFIETKS
jgi:hypothetical protein